MVRNTLLALNNVSDWYQFHFVFLCDLYALIATIVGNFFTHFNFSSVCPRVYIATAITIACFGAFNIFWSLIMYSGLEQMRSGAKSGVHRVLFVVASHYFATFLVRIGTSSWALELRFLFFVRIPLQLTII